MSNVTRNDKSLMHESRNQILTSLSSPQTGPLPQLDSRSFDSLLPALNSELDCPNDYFTKVSCLYNIQITSSSDMI